VRSAGCEGAMVVNRQGVVLGRLHSSQMENDPDRTVEEVMQESPSTVRADLSVHESMHCQLQ
jgi:hypothetical protein